MIRTATRWLVATTAAIALLVSPATDAASPQPSAVDPATVPANAAAVRLGPTGDLSRYVIGSGGIPPSTAYQPSGNFRFICNVSHFGYDDPIVFPGQPGASHLHMFFGNSLTNAFSTYDSLRQSGWGTCHGNALNRSAYWSPAVINAAGKVVVADYAAVYYKGFGTTTSISQIRQFPAGLRMIAGFNPASPTAPGHYFWRARSARSNRRPSRPAPSGSESAS